MRVASRYLYQTSVAVPEGENPPAKGLRRESLKSNQGGKQVLSRYSIEQGQRVKVKGEAKGS